MPIYEYLCRDCSKQFETLVSGAETPECPSCHGARLEKQLSVFGVGKSESPRPAGACGSCGDPRGPGSCSN
jgi:putative FmdB family regulatory protein